MATVVRMPSVMANANEGAIQTWLATEGQSISIGDPLVEIETEKAIVEYAAEVEGTVGKLLAQEGDNLVVGTPIAVILAVGEGQDQIGPALEAAGVAVGNDAAAAPAPVDAAPAAEPAPASTAAAPAVVSAGTAPSGTNTELVNTDGRLFASPIVRRLAKERGLDLGSIVGSGPSGRIVRRDLDGGTAVAPEAATPASATPATPAASTPASPASAATDAGFTDIKLTGMRRAIARRLTESKTTVPHFYLTANPVVDKLLALRREINETAPRKISVNDFVIKAVAGALVEVPAANSIWGGDHIRRFDRVDIAVAVAVDDGLLTPVVRDAGNATLGQISATVAELAERARAGRLRQEELEGGAFSISNLGMYGVDEFSAILNPPQSGILAVSAAKPRPVVDGDGGLAVATVMTVTLSADHRVIDGAVAAAWMAAFVKRVENPLSILI
jgi:pyruvate dehydrogenase E2 component (dihydrolipoamide acetyltransferase)